MEVRKKLKEGGEREKGRMRRGEVGRRIGSEAVRELEILSCSRLAMRCWMAQSVI